jgi:hypothetical protein
MSDIPTFDLQAEIARIDRDREETRKFAAEQHKLMREAEKFRAEEHKLWRDWRLAPWVLGWAVLSGVIAGIVARHL